MKKIVSRIIYALIVTFICLNISSCNDKLAIEKKIEEVNAEDGNPLKTKYSENSNVSENCEPAKESKALNERWVCSKKDPKSDRYWTDMKKAEDETRRMLLNKEVSLLALYLSCDAYDLTWYEMHCESDRLQVEKGHIKSLIYYLVESAPTAIQKGIWKQKKPDPRIFRNPRWILRSRLVFKNLKLKDPWKVEPHPTERGTIILLEQKLDGKINIVGIPITGIVDNI